MFARIRLASRLLAAGLWACASSSELHAASPATEDDICALAVGLLGEIQSIEPEQPGIRPLGYVQRNEIMRQVQVGCFVKGGDVIRAGPGTVVHVELPDRRVTFVRFGDPLIIPQVASPTYTRKIIILLRELAGSNVETAREAAIGRIGATRSPSDGLPQVTISALVGLGPQQVDISHALHIHWEGGIAPFNLKLVPEHANSTALKIDNLTSRHAEIDLTRVHAGAFNLDISDKNNVPLTVKLNIVSSELVPAIQELDGDADEESRELVAAVWLLTRAPTRWRLEALSRLDMLASTRGNLVAGSIINYRSSDRQLTK
jgi:hypothetical protein